VLDHPGMESRGSPGVGPGTSVNVEPCRSFKGARQRACFCELKQSTRAHRHLLARIQLGASVDFSTASGPTLYRETSLVLCIVLLRSRGCSPRLTMTLAHVRCFRNKNRIAERDKMSMHVLGVFRCGFWRSSQTADRSNATHRAIASYRRPYSMSDASGEPSRHQSVPW
jgi:hypothetical protein